MGNVKELTRQIGRTPFAHSRVLIEDPERIPVFGFDLIPGEGLDRPAKALRLQAFFTDVLAFARIETGQKAIKVTVAMVLPMKLLAFAGHQAKGLRRLCLCLRAERGMERRQFIVLRQLHGPLHQCCQSGFFKSRSRQKPSPSCRGMGHRNLQLRVIMPTRAFIGMRPAVIKDVLAL